MKFIGIIPARYASTRFPGKPLVEINGVSMIRRVYEQASKCGSLSAVIVATDDERIMKHVSEFGGTAVMTSASHPSGTDRCFEAYKVNSSNEEIIVNIQGDEPFIQPAQIDLICSCFAKRDTEIATLVKKIITQEELFNENIPKVILTENKEAAYFSRQTIPFFRGVDKNEWLKKHEYFKHIGMYAYRKDVLEKITGLNPSSLEVAESLEQLRWLENGFKIRVEITDVESQAVDVPSDLDKLKF
jgi:3-deoxy-manno-octulosonate cytidylyltransferase (CMP-KDO synthetase)